MRSAKFASSTMMKSPLLKSFLITLFLVGALETITLELHLFSTIMWFDMVMHFWGGFFIGIFALWVLTWNGRKNFSYGQILFWSVASAFIVGVLWELFELYYGITYFYSAGYWGDNGMDVTMDTLGGLISAWYGYLKIRTFKL